MSCMLAMPCTTVQKMIGAMIILISLMKASPKRLHLLAELRVEMAEQDAERDRGQHLEVEAPEERPVMRRHRGGCCASDGHGGLPPLGVFSVSVHGE